MVEKGSSILVGISGGPDSVCLLHVLCSILKECNIAAIYVNHGLRPEEVPHEIEFCKNLTRRLNVPFIVKNLSVKGKKGTEGKQALLRHLRYEIFKETAFETNSDRIALAHTLDDLAETVLINFIRGAGLAGIGGIPARRGEFIRPFIDVSKNEIFDYLGTNKLTYMVDSSNLKEVYLRNHIRKTVIPILKNINNNVLGTISRNAHIIRQENDYLENLTFDLFKKNLLKSTNDTVSLNIDGLLQLETVPLRRILQWAIKTLQGDLKGIEFVHVEDIATLLKGSENGSYITLPRGITVIKCYVSLDFTYLREVKLKNYDLPVPGDVFLSEIGKRIVSYYTNEHDFTTDQKECIIDAHKVTGDLTLRGRLSGDYFYPLGFGKKKKIQDYFVDNKIARHLRDSIPLVCMNEQIIWVAGYRLDERFKVDNKTKMFLKIELK